MIAGNTPYLLIIAVIVTGLATPLVSAESLVNSRTLNFPAPASSSDTRPQYPEHLLRLLVQNTNNKYQIKRSSFTAQQGRNFDLLSKKYIDITWSAENRERTTSFIKIPFKMYKGLLGWRLMLIHKDNTEMLKNVKTKDDLRQFSFGFGTSWAEVKQYEQQSFPVVVASSYDGLFMMLAKKRFDVFSRSVIEIWQEKAYFSSLPIVIDKHVLLKTELGNYFFVHQDDKELAQDLTIAFEKIIQNGEFEQLFKRQHPDLMNKINETSRTVIYWD